MQDEINLRQWLHETEYILLVDSAVELQNSFYGISANVVSPIVSPNRSMLLTRPALAGFGVRSAGGARIASLNL